MFPLSLCPSAVLLLVPVLVLVLLFLLLLLLVLVLVIDAPGRRTIAARRSGAGNGARRTSCTREAAVRG